MAEAALGLLSRNVWRGFMKPAMFVRMRGRIGGRRGISTERLVVVNKRWDRGDKGVTTYPSEGECPNAEIDDPPSDKL